MKKLTLFLLFIASYNSLFSEKIITQKSDEPDDYYGLQIGGVLSPSFGYRYRDSNSGESNTRPNDRTGFSLPWTLLTINKNWEEQGLEAELWFEVIRANVYSNDTIATRVSTGEPRKADPYTLGIRRGNLKKIIQTDRITHKFIFGIQEMPHTFTQWNDSWDWRYMDTGPMESLGFFNAPADIGLSYLMELSIFQFHFGLANGEGYRSIQNAESTGIDGFGRISVQPKWEEWTFGIHLIGRTKNWIGLAGNECREGRSDCLPSDNNLNTFLEKDLRSRKGETAGVEWTIDQNQYLHLGLGHIWRRDYGGEIRDRLNQDRAVRYERDQFGRSFYAWLGFGFENFWLVLRGERSSGTSGRLDANQEEKNEFLLRYNDPSNISSDYLFSNKSYFIRRSAIIEYRWTDNFRIAIGGNQINNFDSNGEKERVFIDQGGEARSKNEFQEQFGNQSYQGIMSFRKIERQVFVRATYIF
ncbi:MAG: hypothetical protein JJT78_05665 [Leptospira sp.]|nr:hypothetical protein [Leptospira sp.]